MAITTIKVNIDTSEIAKAFAQMNDDFKVVVRCKDCKHGRLYEPNCVDCEYMELAREADWFCADGERK